MRIQRWTNTVATAAVALATSVLIAGAAIAADESEPPAVAEGKSQGAEKSTGRGNADWGQRNAAEARSKGDRLKEAGGDTADGASRKVKRSQDKAARKLDKEQRKAEKRERKAEKKARKHRHQAERKASASAAEIGESANEKAAESGREASKTAGELQQGAGEKLGDASDEASRALGGSMSATE